MNIPASATLAMPGTAAAAEPPAGGLPPVAAAAAPAAAATPAAPATPTPSAAAGSGAFNALLAGLGLLPTAAEGTGHEVAEPADAQADERAETVPAADALPGLLQLPAEKPVPAAELTPAWRSDAAMLMASLPPAATAQQDPAEPTAAPAAAALPMPATTQAAAAITGSLPAAPAAHAVMPAARAARPMSGDRQAAPAPAPPADMPAIRSAQLASPVLPSPAAVLPREAAPVQPLDGNSPQAGRRDDPAATAFAMPPADGAAVAMDAAAPTASVSAAGKPVPAHGQALLEALGERVQVQIAQRSEHAVIRLDPQAMGSVEIVLRHEAGALQVQFTASHPDVQRQLQGISEALRQDLSQRQYTDVSVNVAAQQHGDADGRRRQGGQQPAPEQRPGQALAEAERGSTAGAFSMASSLE